MTNEERDIELQRIDGWVCSDAIKEVVRSLLKERDKLFSELEKHADILSFKHWMERARIAEKDLFEARADNARLRAELEFYASEESYCNGYVGKDFHDEAVLEDEGNKARQALSTQSSGAALLEAIRGAIEQNNFILQESKQIFDKKECSHETACALRCFGFALRSNDILKAAMGEK